LKFHHASAHTHEIIHQYTNVNAWTMKGKKETYLDNIPGSTSGNLKQTR